jgi:hypothetical protein
VRLVHRTLLLRGGRDLELARQLEEALVDLDTDAKGGVAVLYTGDDDKSDAFDLQLARLVSALPKHKRSKLVELVLEVDGKSVLRSELDRLAELERLLAMRAVR